MTMLNPGAHWAQPVTRKRWVPVTIVTEWIKRASNYRLAVRAAHRSWQRACGI